MEAYSDDLRERVAEAYDKGAGSLRELAELFGVSHAWIGKLLKLRRERARARSRRSHNATARRGCSVRSSVIG